MLSAILHPNVLVAGSGPIAAAYARTIIDKHPTASVLMVEIGSQDNPIIGAHHKNSIKYQKDIDTFVHVINGALQPVSVSPADTYIPTLGGNSWQPSPQDVLIFQNSNPNQRREVNLKSSAVTRTVGGMATHWTCACPTPHTEELVNNPIPKAELVPLFERGKKLLNVHPDQYDGSIRHEVVKSTLKTALGKRDVENLPLAVERRKDNPAYVTWSGPNTVLGDAVKNDRFHLWSEARVTKVIEREGMAKAVLVRDLATDMDVIVLVKSVVIACGAVGTPQVLANSGIHPQALGRYLCEQSIAFCQIVLKRDIVEDIEHNPKFADKVAAHHAKYPTDPLPIPFDEPEPQVTIPYSHEHPWHTQIHRDAFSYGGVGPRADSRVWTPGVTDSYGMPQATFEVTRSRVDHETDHKMMNDMTDVANALGGYLPGSEPQFMEPGLALHITFLQGTTRIGTDPATSVADPSSMVHGYKNIWSVVMVVFRIRRPATPLLQVSVAFFV
ncbi:hypothetical protein CPB85DRAFT_105397 [Mucidula mucida]|nr:hypothetical protein CPB85DRAFT_105397 [Mucidula mucida]